MRFADFSFFSIWFSVFVKNTSGFSVLVPNVVFSFSYFFFPIWRYLGIQFCLGFSVLADFVCGFAVLDEFFFGFAVSSIPQCPPHKLYLLYSRLSVSVVARVFEVLNNLS